MRNELQAALEDAIRYHELQAKSIQETLSKANYPRTIELLYEDAKGYNETAIAALRDVLQRQPDPITGLVPCGCGGKAKIWPSDPTQFTHVITDYEVGCAECAMTTGWVRGKQENAMNVWNTAMGCPDCGRPLSGNPEQEGF